MRQMILYLIMEIGKQTMIQVGGQHYGIIDGLDVRIISYNIIWPSPMSFC